jgi:hypothetical protein
MGFVVGFSRAIEPSFPGLIYLSRIYAACVRSEELE